MVIKNISQSSEVQLLIRTTILENSEEGERRYRKGVAGGERRRSSVNRGDT